MKWVSYRDFGAKGDGKTDIFLVNKESGKQPRVSDNPFMFREVEVKCQ